MVAMHFTYRSVLTTLPFAINSLTAVTFDPCLQIIIAYGNQNMLDRIGSRASRSPVVGGDGVAMR